MQSRRKSEIDEMEKSKFQLLVADCGTVLVLALYVILFCIHVANDIPNMNTIGAMRDPMPLDKFVVLFGVLSYLFY